MKTVITSGGLITNEFPGLSPNPHECHQFEYAVQYTETGVLSNIEWYTEGALPVGLTIHPETGIISGIIHPLHRQPDCQDNLAPKEPLNPDGSNRNNNGTYNGTSHTFEFSVFRRYMIANPDYISDPTLEPEIEETSDPAVLSIMVIKSGNISNTIFMESYVNTEDKEVSELLLGLDGILGLSVSTDKAHITYDGKKYYKDDLEILYAEHPGPFATCPPEE